MSLILAFKHYRVWFRMLTVFQTPPPLTLLCRVEPRYKNGMLRTKVTTFITFQPRPVDGLRVFRRFKSVKGSLSTTSLAAQLIGCKPDHSRFGKIKNNKK